MTTYLRSTNYSRVFGAGFAGVLAVFSCLAPAAAAVISVSPTAETFVINSGAGAADTYASQGVNNLLGGSIYQGSGVGEYAFLRFDLSLIPEGAVISSATLKLTSAFTYSYSNGETLRFWQMNSGNAAWTQSTGTTGSTGAYLNQTSYVSPSENGGTPWASGGIFNVSPGDLGEQVGAVALTGVNAEQTYSYTLDPAAVNNWLTNSTLANAGLVFHMTNNENPAADSRFLYFFSTNGAPGGMQPQLELTYAPIPEPSSVALLLLGGGAAVWVMRRKADQSIRS